MPVTLVQREQAHLSNPNCVDWEGYPVLYSDLSAAAPGLAEEIENLEKSSAARPRLRARIATWSYNMIVVSLMTATMIAWALLLGWFINRFS